MQEIISLYLLTLTAMALGLLLASLPYLGGRIEGRPHPLWALSLALFIASMGSFAWISARSQMLGISHFGLTTFANVALFAAALLQAAFFRSLNASEQKPRFFVIALLILSFAGVFEWVRQTLDFDARVLLLNGTIGATLIWQITEIRHLHSRNSTPQITFLLWTTFAELGCTVLRFMLAVSNETHVAHFNQIPAVLLLATLLNVLFNVLSYVGINKFWAEKTSFDRASALLESTQIKALNTEKDRLILRLIAANKTAASGALSASLTHELAQPLTALGLNLTSLKHSLVQLPQTEPQQHLLEACVDNTHRLHTALKTLRGMFIANDVAEEDFSITKVLQSVQQLIEKEAQRHAISLCVDCDDELVIRGRPSELQHALLNLTLNAIEALSTMESEHRTLHLMASTNVDAVTITVTDNGPGVASAMSERLFNMLDSDKPGGMGLGLWLCRHIAERHGGTITHRPNSPTGAIFVIALPRNSLSIEAAAT
jgi:signal transduction histidine kinase